MSQRNARVAGFTFLLYYATAFSEMGLSSHSAGAHAMQLLVVLAMISILCALVLAVTLYAITRAVDREVALVALSCRFIEAVMNSVKAAVRIGLLSLATTGVAAQAQTTFLQKCMSWSGTVSGTIFAVGSTLFAVLFVRGRGIPAPLAWLGVIGSAIVILIFPMRAFRFVSGAAVWQASIPLIVFEITLAFWLLFKGVARA
jgi:hypothetical protein